jgi:hypothetical protein
MPEPSHSEVNCDTSASTISFSFSTIEVPLFAERTPPFLWRQFAFREPSPIVPTWAAAINASGYTTNSILRASRQRV